MAAINQAFHVFATKGPTLSVNSGGRVWGALPAWSSGWAVCLTVQTEVTVATECPSAKQRRGAAPASLGAPALPLLRTELNAE